MVYHTWIFALKGNINIKLSKFQRHGEYWGGGTLQNTQLKYYKVVAVPMLTYADENWTTNRSDKRKTSAAMRFLRPTLSYIDKVVQTYVQN